jgi:murein DD-endopeptidase MepM/ murein hydrolase activator NlpD
MKFSGQKMVGNDRRLVRRQPSQLNSSALIIALVVLLTAASASPAQSLYKYRGQDGEWIYSDRPPDDGSMVEVRQLETEQPKTEISVTHSFEGRTVELIAHNMSFAPVEIVLNIESIRGLQYPDPDLELRWVVPARSDLELFNLDLLEDGSTPFLEYQYQYLAGDPDAVHRAVEPYRAPFAIATNYPVTQAFPNVATHTTRDSYYAIDVAMPIGTDIFAARGGVVFDVATSNFRGGLDPVRDGPAANVIRILHDDGTYAIYAHLNTNTIRVRPGDRVQRGQYIADSGNTGFSSGPHLHFAVVRNSGMQIESVPVTFLGANSDTVVPAAGMALTAY